MELMGCDIHLYIERKNKNGHWEEFKIDERLLPNDRNYQLFTFLADVRNFYDFNIQPQFANRGIPQDSSIPKDSEDWYMGDHSFTYASLNEILKAPWKKYQLKECYFIIFFEYVLPRLCDWPGIISKEGEKNIRIIMGFDN